jgi:hypothetical protein
MQLDDELVEAATIEIEQIIEENSEFIVKALEVYEEFQHLCTERRRVDKFIKTEATREDYLGEIMRFEETEYKIAKTCPINIRMNFVTVECQELNKALIKECEDCIGALTKSVSSRNIERESELSK